MKITHITSSTISDSSGSPTLSLDMVFETGKKAQASVPSGVSVGNFETKPLPAKTALLQIEKEVKPAILNRDFPSQKDLDELLVNLNLGGNVSLALSIAFCRGTEYLRGLNFEKRPPKLLMLVSEGGKHAQNDLTIQEFLVCVSNLEEGRKIYLKVRDVLEEKKIEFDYGQEGGYAPKKISDEEMLKILSQRENIRVGLDMASTSVDHSGLDIKKITENFPVFSLEDPYGEEEWEKWQVLTKEAGEKILVIGDDLTVTNPERVRKAIELAACNGIIVKPNQIGTVSQTLEVIKLAKMANIKTIVSHRAHETTDSFIADLAYYTGADYVKFGAPRQEERLVKYQRLEELVVSQ